MNWLLIPTLAGAFALFIPGAKLTKRATSSRAIAALLAVAVAAAMPALLFSAYYLHLFDRSLWFYAFRAMPLTELTASAAGFSAGILTGLLQRLPLVHQSSLLRRLCPALLLLCLGLLVFVPYAKPIIAPIRVPIVDRWKEGVCMQSTPSTCGPSSAATVARVFGITVTEQEMARECYSYGGGTENWYVARALRRRGLQAEYVVTSPQTRDIPYPSIAGTQLGGPGGAGHFIAILDRKGELYIIGDPLIGRLVVDWWSLQSRYYLTGFFLTVSGKTPVAELDRPPKG